MTGIPRAASDSIFPALFSQKRWLRTLFPKGCLRGCCLPHASSSDRHDSSGIRLHYTSTLRRNDAGILELGLVYTPLMAIPPQETEFVLTGYCTDKCTQVVSGLGPTHPPAFNDHWRAARPRTMVVWVSVLPSPCPARTGPCLCFHGHF